MFFFKVSMQVMTVCCTNGRCLHLDTQMSNILWLHLKHSLCDKIRLAFWVLELQEVKGP
jgi:hypothetical protein